MEVLTELKLQGRSDTICGVTPREHPTGDDGVPKHRRRLLAEIKKAKYGRSVDEIEELLRLFGFTERAATKESSVWNRGSVGLTLPNPKTGSLLVCYVTLAIRKIEEAETSKIPEEKVS